MKTHNVLIPGAGGAAGIGAIKSLRLVKFKGKIIATDSNPLSAGLFLADKKYVVPLANDPAFIKNILNIIELENIDIVLPTSGFDIIPYSLHRKNLEEKGISIIVSDYETIQTCINKKEFYYYVKDKFSVPFTTTDISKIYDFPCVVKPIFGKGSRDVFVCRNEKELENIMSKHEDMIIQEYLPGKEYTIDVLSDLDKNGIIAVPRERIEVKAGISFKGRIIRNREMEEESLELVEYLGIRGPSCIQMKEDKDGIPKITEVNPRLCGGTILTTYAGANFPYLLLKMVDGEKIKVPEIKEFTMVRYYEEIILDDKGEVIRI